MNHEQRHAHDGAVAARGHRGLFDGAPRVARAERAQHAGAAADALGHGELEQAINRRCAAVKLDRASRDPVHDSRRPHHHRIIGSVVGFDAAEHVAAPSLTAGDCGTGVGRIVGWTAKRTDRRRYAQVDDARLGACDELAKRLLAFVTRRHHCLLVDGSRRQLASVVVVVVELRRPWRRRPAQLMTLEGRQDVARLGPWPRKAAALR